MSVASVTNMAEIWLPSASPSSSGRVDTGTMATNALLRLLPPLVEQPSQTPRHPRQNHVIDRAAERVADELRVLERDRQRREALAIGHRAVERGARRREEAGR